MADDGNFRRNSAATFEELRTLPATDPLEFDEPIVGGSVKIEAGRVFNPDTQGSAIVNDIIYEQLLGDARHPARAYWMGRSMRPCTFGSVRFCVVLRFRNDVHMPYEITRDREAVKVLSWENMRRIRHTQDPKNEVAALQYLARGAVHQNVMSANVALEDFKNLYLFIPSSCGSHSLEEMIRGQALSEPTAKYWFRQIVEGLSHLQKMGVCHRDISPENVVIDRATRSAKIINFGMCIRVPYRHDASGGVTDVVEGSLRRLVVRSGACGNVWCASPEIYANKVEYDGFAADLWGAAVTLMIMLIGHQPWDAPTRTEPSYVQVALWRRRNDIMDVLEGNGVEILFREWFFLEINQVAADLLQGMLRHDPRNRLSLSQVQHHLWLQNVAELGELDDSDDNRINLIHPIWLP